METGKRQAVPNIKYTRTKPSTTASKNTRTMESKEKTATYRFENHNELVSEIELLREELRRLEFIYEQWEDVEGNHNFQEYEYAPAYDYQREKYEKDLIAEGKTITQKKTYVKPMNHHIAKLIECDEFTYEQLCWYLLSHRCEFSKAGVRKAFKRGNDYIVNGIREMDEKVIEIIEQEKKTPFDILNDYSRTFIRRKG
jgi:hypothetical protein